MSTSFKPLRRQVNLEPLDMQRQCFAAIALIPRHGEISEEHLKVKMSEALGNHYIILNMLLIFFFTDTQSRALYNSTSLRRV